MNAETPTVDERPRFSDFLSERVAGSPLPADEAVAAVAPLFRQVIAAHEAGRVAPLEGVEHLFVADGLHLWFEDGQRRAPREVPEVLHRLERPLQGPLDVVAEVRQVDDVESGRIEEHDLTIGRPGDEIVRPVYLPVYRTWEHRIGHHDALTDVLSLGLILAILACGLDLRERHDLERLVCRRNNLFQLAPGLNPVLAQVIVRHRRAQDLPGLLRRLERYREIDVDVEFDVEHIPGFLDYLPATLDKIRLEAGRDEKELPRGGNARPQAHRRDGEKTRPGPDQLTLHADRGTSMTAKTLALKLADLGLNKSHS